MIDADDRRHVLVIEDDPSVSGLMRELLDLEGYRVSVASDGLAGLLRVQMAGPDAALLDLMMPDVDGLRVLEQLLEEGDGTLPVPVVVMTGSPEGAARAKLILGDDNVFLKPFQPQELLDRLEAVIVAAEEAAGEGGGA